MVKVNKNNLILSGLSGKLGNLVFSQMPDGSTRMSVSPAYRSRKRKPGEKANQQRFKKRAQWAKEASKYYPIYAELAKDRPNINAYNLAISDYAHPPVIHCIERVEGVIRIHVTDDVFVVDVNVKISAADGKRLTEGKATRVDAEWWEYATNLEVTVEVTAHDLPWNETKLTV